MLNQQRSLVVSDHSEHRSVADRVRDISLALHLYLFLVVMMPDDLTDG
jgi:hypothetical protein